MSKLEEHKGVVGYFTQHRHGGRSTASAIKQQEKINTCKLFDLQELEHANDGEAGINARGIRNLSRAWRLGRRVYAPEKSTYLFKYRAKKYYKTAWNQYYCTFLTSYGATDCMLITAIEYHRIYNKYKKEALNAN